MQIRELFWNPDSENFAEMFNVQPSSAIGISRQINELTKDFNKKFSGRNLSPRELEELSYVISNPARFLYRVYGELEVKSHADVILMYSLATQTYERVKATVPIDLMQLLMDIQKRKLNFKKKK